MNVRKPAKIWKEEKLDYLMAYDLEGSIDEAIKKIQEWPKAYSNHKDFKLIYEHNGEDGADGLALVAKRLETDEELNKRAKANSQAKGRRQKEKELKKQEELKLLEQLQKKYGGDNKQLCDNNKE